jgi:hypothetical protein
MSRDGIEVEVTAQHDEEAIVEPGALKLVVFEMLKASARKESDDSQGKTKFLKIDASYCRCMSDSNTFARTAP